MQKRKRRRKTRRKRRNKNLVLCYKSEIVLRFFFMYVAFSQLPLSVGFHSTATYPQSCEAMQQHSHSTYRLHVVSIMPSCKRPIDESFIVVVVIVIVTISIASASTTPTTSTTSTIGGGWRRMQGHWQRWAGILLFFGHGAVERC